MKISREKRNDINKKVTDSMSKIHGEIKTISSNKRNSEVILRRLWNIESELANVYTIFDMVEELNVDMGVHQIGFSKEKFCEGVYTGLVKIIDLDIIMILKNEMIFTRLKMLYEYEDNKAAKKRLEEKRNNAYDDDKYYGVTYIDYVDDMYGGSHMIVEEDVMLGKRLNSFPKDFIISVEDIPKKELID